MNYKTDKDVFNRIKEHYDYIKNLGYEVVFIAHQGSFNYGLQYENSDVDTKAMILPSLEDFILNKKPISTTIELENNEHIDIKDIRIMFEMFKKMNISYIELLYTKYIIVNSKYKQYFDELIANRDDISKINTNQFLKSIAGMSKEKVKALCHPYPNIKEKIDKYGFDGKQLSHCIRLCEFINRYVKGTPLEECYKSQLKTELINMKKNLNVNGVGYMSVDNAKKLCESFNRITNDIKEKYLTDEDELNLKGLKVLENVQYKILKEALLNDTKNN